MLPGAMAANGSANGSTDIVVDVPPLDGSGEENAAAHATEEQGERADGHEGGVAVADSSAIVSPFATAEGDLERGSVSAGKEDKDLRGLEQHKVLTATVVCFAALR